MIGLTIEELKVGFRKSISKTITETVIYLYAGITGDFNPVHINQIYAENTSFKSRIAHGMLVCGLISAVIANKLPGPGTIYVEQNIRFKAPVYIGDTITASVEVEKIYINNNRVKLITRCENHQGDLVIDGDALVSPPKG